MRYVHASRSIKSLLERARAENKKEETADEKSKPHLKI